MSRVKKRGFTDRLYYLNLFLSWMFVVVCIILTTWQQELGITDLSIISYGMPAVFAELGIHSAFVIWKAKAENMAKWNKDNITM